MAIAASCFAPTARAVAPKIVTCGTPDFAPFRAAAKAENCEKSDAPLVRGMCNMFRTAFLTCRHPDPRAKRLIGPLTVYAKRATLEDKHEYTVWKAEFVRKNGAWTLHEIAADAVVPVKPQP